MAERLKLKAPIMPFSVSQRFGEDLACVDVATRTRCIARMSGGICQPGYESLYTSAGMLGHNGIDLNAEDKQPVFAATDGFIYKLSAEEDRGIGVEVISRKRYALEGLRRPYRIKTRYWHLHSYCVAKGQKVREGDLIGWADNTGLSSGTHLHFELKPVRRGFWGRFRNVFQKNGYFGAIDPEPYFIRIP